MEKMSPDTFKERLAVIVEDEEKDKKRFIHDATHGVSVNHWLKCRDKLRAPGAREKKQLLLEAMERKEFPVSIAVAGSRTWLRSEGQLVNKVGTFASTAPAIGGPG